jgi:catechol 2,3-dioxygenase-like lactoylglutathione lyase family enzyme
MSLDLSRVIIFTPNMAAMTAFYRDVIGLRPANQAPGWIELSAGACSIALHDSKRRAPEGPVKIVFYAADVAAERAALVARGAPMGRVVSVGAIHLCDGVDPDGNAIQISSRPRASAGQ